MKAKTTLRDTCTITPSVLHSRETKLTDLLNLKRYCVIPTLASPSYVIATRLRNRLVLTNCLVLMLLDVRDFLYTEYYAKIKAHLIL